MLYSCYVCNEYYEWVCRIILEYKFLEGDIEFMCIYINLVAEFVWFFFWTLLKSHSVYQPIKGCRPYGLYIL